MIMTKGQFKRLRPGNLIIDSSGVYSIMDIGLTTFRVKLIQASNPGWASITYPLVLSTTIVKQMRPYSARAKNYYKLKSYLHFLYMKWIKHHCRHFCLFCAHDGCECYSEYIDSL